MRLNFARMKTSASAGAVAWIESFSIRGSFSDSDALTSLTWLCMLLLLLYTHTCFFIYRRVFEMLQSIQMRMASFAPRIIQTVRHNIQLINILPTTSTTVVKQRRYFQKSLKEYQSDMEPVKLVTVSSKGARIIFS